MADVLWVFLCSNQGLGVGVVLSYPISGHSFTPGDRLGAHQGQAHMDVDMTPGGVTASGCLWAPGAHWSCEHEMVRWGAGRTRWER